MELKVDRGQRAQVEIRQREGASFVNMFSSGCSHALQRTSKQYIDGLSVAQTEYDRELKARREAEAEVTRLRVLLSGQAARLTALSGDNRRQEIRQKATREMDERLSGLQQDLSKLKVERDMTLAEVEELNTAKRCAILALYLCIYLT